MVERADILLIDDDRNDVDVALRAVRRANLGLEVAVANGGGEALEMLGIESESEPQVVPRVVFLDLKMPGVDGWEVLQRIRENPSTQTLPVVILSWSGQADDVERCYSLGANSYLVKRVEAAKPGAYFAQAASYWANLNESPTLD
jgi:CheY-like chemotaxis protein